MNKYKPWYKPARWAPASSGGRPTEECRHRSWTASAAEQHRASRSSPEDQLWSIFRVLNWSRNIKMLYSLSCTNGLKIEILTDNQSHLSAAWLYICKFQGLWVWITKWLSKLFFWHSAQTLPLNYFLSSGRQRRLYDHYILEDTSAASALYFTGSLFTAILLSSFLTTTSQLPDRGKLKRANRFVSQPAVKVVYNITLPGILVNSDLR